MHPKPTGNAKVGLLKDDGLGRSIRATRERKGLSLRELARQVNVSPSLISQIERGRAMPSVGTLFTIATILDLDLGDMFSSQGVEQETPSDAAVGAPTPSPDRPAGPVQRKHNRKKIKLHTGVVWELLTPAADDQVEFLHVTYDVGGASCEDGVLFRHGGMEYGYILSGRLGMQIGFEEYVLEPGDSLSFSAQTPHRLWAIGNEPAVAIFTIIRRHSDSRMVSHDKE